jgi:hypothetical protein
MEEKSSVLKEISCLVAASLFRFTKSVRYKDSVLKVDKIKCIS